MRLNQRKRRVARSGFTLIEVMLVVAILVTLAAMVIPNFIGMQDQANRNIAKTQVREFENAAQNYKILFGDWPANLQAMTQVPANAPPSSQPVLKNSSFVDPWGTSYNYQQPGQKNNPGPDIWSNGPDRQPNTQDDVGNWAGK